MSANDLPRGPEEGAPERKTREKPSQEQTDWSGSFSSSERPIGRLRVIPITRQVKKLPNGWPNNRRRLSTRLARWLSR